MSNNNRINRKPRTKLQLSAQEIFDLRIRIKLLELSKDISGTPSVRQAFEMEHYVRTGNLIPYAKLRKAIRESEARD